VVAPGADRPCFFVTHARAGTDARSSARSQPWSKVYPRGCAKPPRIKVRGTSVTRTLVPRFRECVYNRQAGYAHTAGIGSCCLRANSCQLAARRPAGAQACDSCCRNTSGRMQQPGARPRVAQPRRDCPAAPAYGGRWPWVSSSRLDGGASTAFCGHGCHSSARTRKISTRYRRVPIYISHS
jgi:hypothetical protein